MRFLVNHENYFAPTTRTIIDKLGTMWVVLSPSLFSVGYSILREVPTHHISPGGTQFVSCLTEAACITTTTPVLRIKNATHARSTFAADCLPP